MPAESPGARFAALALAFLLCGALLVLCLPRLVREAIALPSGPALRAAREALPVESTELDRAASALGHALEWGRAPALLSELALLRLLQVRSGAAPLGHLLEALEVQEESLARAPADSDGWARLAFGRYTLVGMTPAVQDALAASIATGALEASPLRFRVELMLSEWSRLRPALQERAREQIRALGRQRSTDALVDVYLSATPEGRSVVRSALSDDTPLRVGFERRLERAQATPRMNE